MPTNGSTVEAQTTGITINLNLAIGVINPNFFAADFSAIQAKAFYPGVTQQIGMAVACIIILLELTSPLIRWRNSEQHQLPVSFGYDVPVPLCDQLYRVN
jgi:hypothetical protein